MSVFLGQLDLKQGFRLILGIAHHIAILDYPTVLSVYQYQQFFKNAK